MPKVVGRGRSGFKTGDRVHPGGLSLLFTAVPDAEADSTLRFLREIRDKAGAKDTTKLYTLPVEDVS